MNRDITQEDRCELSNISCEIYKMTSLSEHEKCYAIKDMLSAMLGLYDADSILGVARYRLEICRRINAGTQP